MKQTGTLCEDGSRRSSEFDRNSLRIDQEKTEQENDVSSASSLSMEVVDGRQDFDIIPVWHDKEDNRNPGGLRHEADEVSVNHRLTSDASEDRMRSKKRCEADTCTDDDCAVTVALLEEHEQGTVVKAEEKAAIPSEHSNCNSNNGESRSDTLFAHREKKKDYSRRHLLETTDVVVVLNNKRSNKTSRSGCKHWVLRLSHDRRLEIIVALGLFVWIAFIVVLALFINGEVLKTTPLDSKGDKENIEADNTLQNNRQFFASNQSTSNASVTLNRSNDLQHLTVTSSPSSSSSQNSQVGTLAFDSLSSAAFTSRDRLEINKNISRSTSSLRTNSPEQASSLGIKQSLVSEDAPKLGSTTSFFSNAHRQTQPTIVTEAYTVHLGIDGGFTEESKRLTTDGGIWLNETSRPNEQRDVGVTTPNKSENIAKVPDLSTSRTGIRRQYDATYHPAVDEVPQTSDVVAAILQDQTRKFNVGVGRADITGPPADVAMMGYAKPNQVTGGIHTRQYARAFIIDQRKSRIAIVVIDACMGSTLVKLEVLKILKSKYGDLYNAKNLCICATHTHSAPGGYLQDVLFQITSKGYVPETLTAMVNGIVESIRIAHEGLIPGGILLSKGKLGNSSVNRSPSAYLQNPEWERKKYEDNVDKDMVLLKIVNADGKGIGMINWFPVHCTSMNNTNSLISGDNKGYAELMFEHEMDPTSLFGESKFVAAFAQGHEGDVSPNTEGPHCIDTGLPCDNVDSTCNGNPKNCIASGPGKDMFESTKIIGHNQFQKALELYHNATEVLSGPLQAVNQYIDMSNQSVALNSTHSATTCKPAMGFSFAAGTTDGLAPGDFDFKQGDTSGNTFWRYFRNVLHSPSQKQVDCHAPKPIFLDTGEMNTPYPWQSAVVDTQLLRIGRLIISAVPGEFTTMSGRRLRSAVLETFSRCHPDENFLSIVAGLANSYSDYVTTFEEYQVQRYEGASTAYGPHTLSAYIQQYKKLATSLIEEKMPNGSAGVKDLKDQLYSFVPSVKFDHAPFGYSFGDTLKEADDNYISGDVVSVQFVAGNPRNSPTMNMTFLTVERKLSDDTWKVIHTDASWDTKFIWERSSTFGSVLGLSEATIEWSISSASLSGQYRIKHFGHYKGLLGGIYSYTGQSKIFNVTGKSSLQSLS